MRVTNSTTPCADVVLPCLDEAAALPWVLAASRPAGAPSSSTTAPRTARPRSPAPTAPPSCTNRAAASAPPATPGSSPPRPTSSASATATPALDPGLLTAFVRTVTEGGADLVLGRRRPQERGAWPMHAAGSAIALTRMLRRRTGLTLGDLGPLRAARREPLLDARPAPTRRSGYPLRDGRAGRGRGMADRGTRDAVPAAHREVEGHRHLAGRLARGARYARRAAPAPVAHDLALLGGRAVRPAPREDANPAEVPSAPDRPGSGPDAIGGPPRGRTSVRPPATDLPTRTGRRCSSSPRNRCPGG
ncbi:hypothetical protein SANTM175S_04927 [Streptomyces antimycoticus]